MPARMDEREGARGMVDASAQCHVDIEHTRDFDRELRNAQRKTRLDNTRVSSLIGFPLPFTLPGFSAPTDMIMPEGVL